MKMIAKVRLPKFFISYQIKLLIGTFRPYAMKSITNILDSETVAVHDSPRRFFTSLASSDVGNFRKLPSVSDKTKCLQFRMIVDTANQTFLILNNQRSEENWLSPSHVILPSRVDEQLFSAQLYTLFVEPVFLEFLISILPFGKAFQQKRRCLIIKSCPSDKAFWCCSICISFNPTSHLI